MWRILLRALRLPAALLYGAAALGFPVAHAQAEEISADPAIEAGHSGECPVLHVEVACTVAGAAEIPNGLSGTAYAAPPIAYRLRPDPSSSSIPSISRVGPKSERGPPLRA